MSRDLLRTRPARLRWGAIGIELAEDGQMLVQHYPPVLATPDSQKLEKRPLPNSSDQPAERDHDSVINDVITQNATNKSSIQLISRDCGRYAHYWAPPAVG